MPNRTTQNLFANSEAVGSWLLVLCTVTPNTTANPLDGAMTADTLVDSNDVAPQYHYAYQSTPSTGVSLRNGELVTFSVYAKAGTKSQIMMSDFLGAYAIFDLSTGTVLSYGANYTKAFRIYPVPNQAGWYRCSITYCLAASTPSSIIIASGGTGNYQGNGTGTVILYGGQLVRANWEGDYYATTTANPHGTIFNIIPEQQNLTRYSEQFDSAPTWLVSNTTVTANTADTLDPIGGNTADILVETAANDYHGISFTPLLNSPRIGQTCNRLVSVYAKKATRDYFRIYTTAGYTSVWFNLATGVVHTYSVAGGFYISSGIQSVGNGWYRCWVLDRYNSTYPAIGFYANITAPENGYQGVLNQKAVYLWGAQVEQCNVMGKYVKTESFPYNYGARRQIV